MRRQQGGRCGGLVATRHSFCRLVAVSLVCAGAAGSPLAQEAPVKPPAAADTAAKGNPEKSRWMALLSEGESEIKASPKQVAGWMKCGFARFQLAQYKEADADFSKILELRPDELEALNRRGAARFFQGDIKGSLADFDAFLQARPKEKPGHWQRGIALYYAGDFAEGARQFEGYQAVDSNDVENAVWHFLCNAAKEGIAEARKKILPIGRDRRAPLMEIYSLFKDEIKESDVLKGVAKLPAGPQKDQALFYGHLYLALWRETNRDKEGTLAHLKEACGPYRNYQYMGEVARVHKEWIEAGKWPKLPKLEP